VPPPAVTAADLARAIASNSEADITRWLRSGQVRDVNELHRGYGAIHRAAYAGSVGVVRGLIAHGADLSRENKHGENALEAARSNATAAGAAAAAVIARAMGRPAAKAAKGKPRSSPPPPPPPKQRANNAGVAAAKAAAAARKAKAAAAAAAAVAKKAKKTCCICMEDHPARGGYVCDSAADPCFTCDECFAMHVRTKMEEDVGLLEAAKGCVFCPNRTADGAHGSTAVDPVDIVRHAPSAYAAYQAAQVKVMEKQLIEKIRREERERLEAEAKRVAALSALERETEEAQRHVRDKILTLACPRCGQAFLDFEGCFALTCPRCACAFCAWCLKDCGGDAHAHAAACGQQRGKNRYWGSAAEFDAVQVQRRTDALRLYLGGLRGEVRARVVAGCGQDLRDLGMQALIAEFAAA